MLGLTHLAGLLARESPFGEHLPQRAYRRVTVVYLLSVVIPYSGGVVNAQLIVLLGIDEPIIVLDELDLEAVIVPQHRP